MGCVWGPHRYKGAIFFLFSYVSITMWSYHYVRPGSEISGNRQRKSSKHTWRALVPMLFRYAAKILVDMHSPNDTSLS